MKVEGINTTGVSIGNGILFINGVFQTPTTINNAGNNYEFENDNIAGISSVVFTGITSTDGTYIKSDFDINQNQLPRGGLIVSLGSTPGLGYAPLYGAKLERILMDLEQLSALLEFLIQVLVNLLVLHHMIIRLVLLKLLHLLITILLVVIE